MEEVTSGVVVFGSELTFAISVEVLADTSFTSSCSSVIWEDIFFTMTCSSSTLCLSEESVIESC